MTPALISEAPRASTRGILAKAGGGITKVEKKRGEERAFDTGVSRAEEVISVPGGFKGA